MKILLGTSNAGKVAEYKWIFDEQGFEILTPEDLRIVEKPEETGETFMENALLKARFFCEKSSVPTLGDDAGIEIDALGGEPGVKSRRWLGHECTDQELIDHTLKRLRGVPRKMRGAQFRVVCALVFPDGKVLKGQGMQRGFITEEQIKPIITGYPFRSIFVRDDVDASSDSLWQGHYSHRKKAVGQIISQL